MTTPEPPRATSTVPLTQAHAELVADLACTLNLDHGLARILALQVSEIATDVPSSGEAPTITTEAADNAHAMLRADLETILHLSEGLAEILEPESGHARLVSDLSVAIHTTRGLAGILEPAHT